MTKPLSILLLGTQIATGGAQKVLLDQAQWFHQHGHQVFAMFFYDKENLHARWQSAADFRIINLNAFAKNKNLFVKTALLIRGLFSLWQFLQKEKINVIETFTHDSNMLALPFAFLAGVPVRMATHHGKIGGFPRWKEIIHAWIVNTMASCIVAVSEQTRLKSLEEGIHADKIVMIPNGIIPVSIAGINRQSVRAEAGFKQDDVVMLSVGRLVYQKAHEYLVAAMPAVLKEMPNAKVGICGDGVLRADIEAQIRSLKLEDQVKLFGMQADVTKYLAAADIFILSSRWEGLPIALLEAMSTGLPVISTKVEGVEEVIVEGEHGLLVPIENTNALANAIIQLLSDPQLRHKMGAAAKAKVVESYTADRMCEQYLALMIPDSLDIT